MCRLFAVHSTRPISLAKPFEALRELSVHHRDGWGVAKFEGDWAVKRDVLPAFESSRFTDIVGEPAPLVSLTHLRLASVGKLDIDNNHPFTSNGWAFMHNGTLRNFAETRAKIEAEIAPEFLKGIKGSTDSERLFALFLTFVQGRSDIEISEAARALSRVTKLAGSMTDSADAKSKMNLIASNGKITLATRRGHTLVMNQERHALSIASQSLNAEKLWREVPEDGLIAVDDTLNLHQSSVVHWR